VGAALGLAALLAAGCAPEQVPERMLGWFLTPDQQGRLWLERGDPERAARCFEDPLWKGLAFYAAEEWEPAAPVLATTQTTGGRFQYANTLARLERLPEAVAAYDAVLAEEPDLAEATFNRDWVAGLLALDEKEYDDAGGTGGKLEADRIVFDDKAANAKGEMTQQEARAQGLSEAELRDMWMRRVQTTPGDFLRLKFAYQTHPAGTP
jgi:Ca-activated chloride channel family protein